MEKPSLLDSARLRRTFGRAISNDPEELYEHANIPLTDPLFADGIIEYLKPQFEKNAQTAFITDGIVDSQTIFDAALEDCPDITEKKDAIQVVHDPVTILAIAELALHSQTRVARYVQRPDRQKFFYIHPERKCLLLGNKLPDHAESKLGCPYAGKETESEEEIKIDPLFKRFVPWAGTLAVLRYFDKQDSYQLDTRLHQQPAI